MKGNNENEGSFLEACEHTAASIIQNFKEELEKALHDPNYKPQNVISEVYTVILERDGDQRFFTASPNETIPILTAKISNMYRLEHAANIARVANDKEVKIKIVKFSNAQVIKEI